jgi:hypothetical protein
MQGILTAARQQPPQSEKEVHIKFKFTAILGALILACLLSEAPAVAASYMKGIHHASYVHQTVSNLPSEEESSSRLSRKG